MTTWIARLLAGYLVTPAKVDWLAKATCDFVDALVRRTHTTLDDQAAAELRRVLTSPEGEKFLLDTLTVLLARGQAPLALPPASETRPLAP